MIYRMGIHAEATFLVSAADEEAALAFAGTLIDGDGWDRTLWECEVVTAVTPGMAYYDSEHREEEDADLPN